jgi:Fur family ferric uptake transcriptional regulator
VKKQPESINFSNFLKKNDLRLTQPRMTILKVFLQMKGHFEVEDVLAEVKKVDGMVSIATVYRTLNLLVECGLAAENTFADKAKKFEVAHEKQHHDHFVCNKCKKVEEFHHPLIESLQGEVAKKHEFSITSHIMTLYGVCSDCK